MQSPKYCQVTVTSRLKASILALLQSLDADKNDVLLKCQYHATHRNNTNLLPNFFIAPDLSFLPSVSNNKLDRPLQDIALCAFRPLRGGWVAGWPSGYGVGLATRWLPVRFPAAAANTGWLTVFQRETTSLFYRATQANSASQPQRDGQSAMMLCGWGVRA